VNHWSSKSTGSFHFSQFSHADRRWTSDRKVHQINLGVSDVLLPAVVAGPTALKCVESDLADETNDLGPLRANGFQCALYARLLLNFIQQPGPVEQIPEHLVVGKRHAAPMRTGMRIDAHKKDSRML